MLIFLFNFVSGLKEVIFFLVNGIERKVFIFYMRYYFFDIGISFGFNLNLVV